MRGWYVIAIGILAVIVAFQIGYLRGLMDRQDKSATADARQAAIDRDISLALSVPSNRTAVCNQVFDLVVDEIERDALDEQKDKARRPDPLGE